HGRFEITELETIPCGGFIAEHGLLRVGWAESKAAGARAAAAEVSRKARRFMDVSFNMLSSLDRCLVLVGSGDDGALVDVGHAPLLRSLLRDGPLSTWPASCHRCGSDCTIGDQPSDRANRSTRAEGPSKGPLTPLELVVLSKKSHRIFGEYVLGSFPAPSHFDHMLGDLFACGIRLCSDRLPARPLFPRDRLLDRRGHRRNHRDQVPLRGDQNR